MFVMDQYRKRQIEVPQVVKGAKYREFCRLDAVENLGGGKSTPYITRIEPELEHVDWNSSQRWKLIRDIGLETLARKNLR